MGSFAALRNVELEIQMKILFSHFFFSGEKVLSCSVWKGRRPSTDNKNKDVEKLRNYARDRVWLKCNNHECLIHDEWWENRGFPDEVLLDEAMMSHASRSKNRLSLIKFWEVSINMSPAARFISTFIAVHRGESNFLTIDWIKQSTC